MSLVHLNGKVVDLTKSQPWTLGDWEDLETEHGISATNLNSLGVKGMISVVFAVCRKANSEVTRADARSLAGFDDPVIDAVLGVLSAKRADPNSSMPSTPSGGPTDGLSPT